MSLIVLIIASYLIGSIPFGLLISKWMSGIDPRQSGSGNMGATNVFRVVGKKEAVLTLIADILKGIIPIFLASFCGIEQKMLFFVGFSAILGHIFPVFLGFRGGKGVAVSLGVFLGIAPEIAFCALIIWIVAFKIWNYSAAGALAAFGALPFLALWMKRDMEFILFSIGLSVLIYFCHRGNIVRLMRGEEKSF
ncbi:MAG: glycerol-3-phosphate 1-O-acyltransferase PlsY [Nitrospirota bacterium]